MSKFRENSSLFENKILETKMVNKNTKLVNAFSNILFSNKLEFSLNLLINSLIF
jgi:hypothetical protein